MLKKYIAHLVACSRPPLVRDGPLGAPAFVKLAYCYHLFNNHNPRFKYMSHDTTIGTPAFQLLLLCFPYSI